MRVYLRFASSTFDDAVICPVCPASYCGPQVLFLLLLLLLLLLVVALSLSTNFPSLPSKRENIL